MLLIVLWFSLQASKEILHILDDDNAFTVVLMDTLQGKGTWYQHTAGFFS
jgi:hypothetical protein